MRSRRTNLRMITERPVPPELIERLCAAATWAPNHHRTWPWRFAALTGDARARLGAIVADALPPDAPAAQVVKTAGKYLRAPVIVVVGCDVVDDEVRAREDRDAVAAGVQNLLLAATAAGLASYWGTGAVTELPGVVELCGFAPTTSVVAVVYVGWPADEAPTPARPHVRVHHVG